MVGSWRLKLWDGLGFRRYVPPFPSLAATETCDDSVSQGSCRVGRATLTRAQDRSQLRFRGLRQDRAGPQEAGVSSTDEAVDNALLMKRRVQEQLATVISCLGGIDALSRVWRENSSLRSHSFLFVTVYDALWDAVIVRLGAIWDGRRDAASLPNLAPLVKDVPGAAGLRDQLRTPRHLARGKLHAHRSRVVAHFNSRQDIAEFDKNFAIDTKDAWADVSAAKDLLSKVDASLGILPFPFADIEEISREDAERSLSLLGEGVHALIAKWERESQGTIP